MRLKISLSQCFSKNPRERIRSNSFTHFLVTKFRSLQCRSIAVFLFDEPRWKMRKTFICSICHQSIERTKTNQRLTSPAIFTLVAALVSPKMPRNCASTPFQGPPSTRICAEIPPTRAIALFRKLLCVLALRLWTSCANRSHRLKNKIEVEVYLLIIVPRNEEAS